MRLVWALNTGTQTKGNRHLNKISSAYSDRKYTYTSTTVFCLSHLICINQSGTIMIAIRVMLSCDSTHATSCAHELSALTTLIGRE